MNVLHSSFGVFLTRLWAAAVGVAISVTIARVLGPEGKGVYSLLLMVPTLLVTLGNVGLQISNIYFYGRNLGRIDKLATNSLWASIVLGLIIVGIFSLIFPFVADRFFADIPNNYLFATVSLVPLMLANAYFGNLLLAIKKIKLFNLANFLQLSTLLITVMVLLLVIKAGLITTIIAIAVNVTTGAGLMIWFFSRQQQFGWKFQVSLFKKTLKYGLKGYFANVIQYLNYRLDLLLVSFYLGTGHVGIYSVAVNFAEVLWYIPTSIGTILFPHVASTNDKAANLITAEAGRQTVMLMSVATVGVAALSPWLIPLLFGEQFTPAVHALLYLLPGVLLFSLAKIIGNDFSGRGLVLINGIVSAVALIVNIALNIVLIPRIGIIGAAIASTISYSSATVILIFLFRHHTRVPIAKLILPGHRDLKQILNVFKKQ